MDYSNLFVVLMGLGTVFAGLLCIILLVFLMSWVCNRTAAPAAPKAASAPAPTGVAAVPASTVTPSMIAAIAAAIAEDMGTDVSAIRIVSVKKV